MKVAWQGLPGMRRHIDPSRRNGMIEFATAKTCFRKRGVVISSKGARSPLRHAYQTNHAVPYGTELFNARIQAVPARLPSFGPYGTGGGGYIRDPFFAPFSRLFLPTAESRFPRVSATSRPAKESVIPTHPSRRQAPRSRIPRWSSVRLEP